MGGSLASKRRGAVHLLTGKNIDGSVIGIAYVDVMCDSITGDAWNGEYEYGISQATQSSLGCNVGLVMHELGHNTLIREGVWGPRRPGVAVAPGRFCICSIR